MVADFMEKVISLTDSIYNLVKEYDEVIEIMEKLGFEGMTNKNTINTVGRIMTLQKGAKFKSIDIIKIRDEFGKYNFIVKE